MDTKPVAADNARVSLVPGTTTRRPSGSLPLWPATIGAPPGIILPGTGMSGTVSSSPARATMVRAIHSRYGLPVTRSITSPSRPNPWLEYLKRVPAGSTGGSASAARSSASSRYGRRSCHWPASRPSRISPALCESNWPMVAAATFGCRPSTWRPTGSSRRSRSASRSFRMPAAVKVLECEATRNRWRGVRASPVARLAWPNARSSTTLPRCATAIAQPGCSDWRIWCSSQRGM